MSKEGKNLRSRLYEVDAQRGLAKLRNRSCPKCGRVMAFHGKPFPRWHCGFCSYVEVARS